MLLLYIAAVLLIGIGITHSVLGERYVLCRLERLDNLPRLTLGGRELMIHVLRFAWHLTSIIWFGFAVILIYMAEGQLENRLIGNVISAIFFAHFLVAVIASKGRHLSWIVFLIVSVATFYASNT